MKTIGILAGMGPYSTAPFLEQVLDECRKQYGAQEDADFPHIIVYSLPTPFSLNAYDPSELENCVISGIKRLASFAVDVIAIPCNTVHSFFEKLDAAVSIPVLNIVTEVGKVVSGKSVILGTAATKESGIYDALEQIEVDQELVNQLIRLCKGKTSSEELLPAIETLRASISGVETIVLACTDLGPITPFLRNWNVIDSSKILAAALVREYLQ